MHDVRADLARLWRAAASLPAREGRARSLLFLSACEGEGTTSLAASFALLAASHTRAATWLVDLDFAGNSAFHGFSRKLAGDVGIPGRAYDASLDAEALFDVDPPLPPGSDARKLLTAHQVEGTRLLVTRLRRDRLHPGQKIRLRRNSAWWEALRTSAEWVIVTAPAMAASDNGLAAVSAMDGVVIVIRADSTEVSETAWLCQQVEQRGGTVLGAVLNGVRGDARLLAR